MRDTTLEERLAAGPDLADQPDTDGFARRALDEGLVDVAVADVDVPFGSLVVAATPAGLVRVAFGREDRSQVLEQLAARISPMLVEAPAQLDPIRRQLDEYFTGRRHHFDLDLDWRLTSGFRGRVLQTLRAEVGFGETVSYRELGALVGKPAASRAVGTAMATNPLPIVVPCHRVLRSGGGIGGYGGGLDVKRFLLRLEGASPA